MTWIPRGCWVLLAALSACKAGPATEWEAPPVYVNELVASNQSGLQDASGAFPDWLELYNDGDELVDLSDWSLTDDPTEPQKSLFPAGTVIDGGGYLVVFADSDPSTADEVHAAFNLSADGEELQLIGPAVADFPIVDEVVFPALESDVAWAYTGEGFEIDATPSPGEPNE